MGSLLCWPDCRWWKAYVKWVVVSLNFFAIVMIPFTALFYAMGMPSPGLFILPAVLVALTLFVVGPVEAGGPARRTDRAWADLRQMNFPTVFFWHLPRWLWYGYRDLMSKLRAL